MKNRRKLLYSLLIAAVCFTLFGLYSSCDASSQEIIGTDSIVSTPLPVQASPSPTIKAFVSNNTYNSAILNCNIPEELKGSDFVVQYEYWTNEDTSKIIKTNVFRTYNNDNFTTVDSYELFNVKYAVKYSFRAFLTVRYNDHSEKIYSDIVNFTSSYAPTAPLKRNVIYGYVSPEFKTDAKTERSGFKVSINGGAAEVTTDSSGYFSFNVSFCDTVFYNIKISKPGYMERNIDIGFIENPQEKEINVSQNGAYTIMMCGDMDNGGSVNMADIMEMVQSFNLNKGDVGYNEVADFNKDDAVNMNDIMLVAKNFNKSGNDYSKSVQIPYIELKSPASRIEGAYFSETYPLNLKLYGYNLKNISGYKVNIVYNPKIVQVIDSSLNTVDSDDALLVNPLFNPEISYKSDPQKGELFISKSYKNITDYKNSGLGESTGKISSIKFKSSGSYSSAYDFIKVYATPDLPAGASYTDWDNNIITEIEVLQPHIFATTALP